MILQQFCTIVKSSIVETRNFYNNTRKFVKSWGFYKDIEYIYTTHHQLCRSSIEVKGSGIHRRWPGNYGDIHDRIPVLTIDINF